MTGKVLGDWPEWRERLILELRYQDVPGKDIGDILTEVEAHVRETGESPAEAFGDPVAYARNRAVTVANPPHPSLGLSGRDTVAWAVCLIGGLMSAGAAWSIGAGDWFWGPIPTIVELIVGLALLFGPLVVMKPDLVTDPRSGQLMFADPKAFRWLVTGSGLVALVLIGVAGWYVGD